MGPPRAVVRDLVRRLCARGGVWFAVRCGAPGHAVSNSRAGGWPLVIVGEVGTRLARQGWPGLCWGPFRLQGRQDQSRAPQDDGSTLSGVVVVVGDGTGTGTAVEPEAREAGQTGWRRRLAAHWGCCCNGIDSDSLNVSGRRRRRARACGSVSGAAELAGWAGRRALLARLRRGSALGPAPAVDARGGTRAVHCRGCGLGWHQLLPRPGRAAHDLSPAPAWWVSHGPWADKSKSDNKQQQERRGRWSVVYGRWPVGGVAPEPEGAL